MLARFPAAFLFIALLLPGAGGAKEPSGDDRAEAKPARTSQSGVKADTTAPTLPQRIRAAENLVDDGDFPGGLQQLRLVIADGRFRGQTRTFRQGVLRVAGWVAMQAYELDLARDYLLQATALDDQAAEAWLWLALVEADRNEPAAAAGHFATYAKGWPELVDKIPDDTFFPLRRTLRPHPAAYRVFLDAAFEAGYRNEALGGVSGLWLDLAMLRLDAGDREGARETLARIDGPMELVQVRSDRRFDGLYDPDAPQFDVEAAARRRVDTLRLQAILDPTRLDIQNELSAAMLTAGQHEDVIALADEVSAALAEAPADSPRYADADAHVWQLNNRAIALRRLGRADEALAQLEAAAGLKEEGSKNVSQALNLGQLYCSLGRPEDALAAIAPVGSMSGYGRMVQASVQQCAALRMGDAAAAATALDYLRDNGEQSPRLLTWALVEADLLDDAAQALIARFESPLERGEALADLQDLRSSPVLPGDVGVQARWDSLVARPDVQAAVAKVGRIGQYAIYRLD